MPRFLDVPAAILLHIGLAMIAFAIIGGTALLMTTAVVATMIMRMMPTRRMRTAVR